MEKTRKQEWLLVFYSVPSHPVSNRMKIWRKLAKAGAVQLKGSVYILPASEEHEEFLQWLIGEVKTLGGDGAFVRTGEIRTLAEKDIVRLFTAQADEEYKRLDRRVEVLERKVQSIRKGSKNEEATRIAEEAAKIAKEAQEIGRRDWFRSSAGNPIRKRLQAIGSGLRDAGGKTAPSAPVIRRQAARYRGKTWATRRNPFVDRMASAWLIRRFIDPKAAFTFINEDQVASLDASQVAFDIRGAEFSHVGDLCTFEVMVKSFGIKDKAVREIAEIVHDLDVKDEKYGNRGTAGIEGILTGIRKTAKDDRDGLERGMAAFEMLYQSKT